MIRLPKPRELPYYRESKAAPETGLLLSPIHGERDWKDLVQVHYLFANSEGATIPRLYFKKGKERKFESHLENGCELLIEPVSKARIILIVCYLSADKGCPPDC